MNEHLIWLRAEIRMRCLELAFQTLKEGDFKINPELVKETSNFYYSIFLNESFATSFKKLKATKLVRKKISLKKKKQFLQP